MKSLYTVFKMFVTYVMLKSGADKTNSYSVEKDGLSVKEGRKEMCYLTTHSTHFIYSYMASDIWLRTTQIAREETRCRHMGYSFRLAARVLLYASSHTYHGLCYTSRGALAGTRNSSTPRRIDPTTHRTMSERSTSELRPAPRFLRLLTVLHFIDNIGTDEQKQDKLWKLRPWFDALRKNFLQIPPKEGNVLFNDTLNTFYLRLYGVRHMVKDHSFQLAAKVLLCAPSHRQDNTYHGLCCTSPLTK